MNTRFAILILFFWCISVRAVNSAPIETPISSVQFQHVEQSLGLPKQAPVFILRHSDFSQWLFYPDKLIRRQGVLLEEKKYPDLVVKKFNLEPRIEAREFDKKIYFSVDTFLMEVNANTLEIDVIDDFSQSKETITGIEQLKNKKVLLTTQQNVYVKPDVLSEPVKVKLHEELFHSKYKSIFPFTTYSNNQNEAWIGSFLGTVYRVSDRNNLEPQIEKFVIPFKGRHFIYSLLQVSRDIVYIGASSGLYKLNASTKEVVRLGEDSDFSNVMNLVLHQEKLWFLSKRKLVVYEFSSGQFIEVNGSDSLDDDSYRVKYLSKDQEGLIWLSVIDKGLYYYSVRKNSIQPIKKAIFDGAGNSFNLVEKLGDNLVIGSGKKTRIISNNKSLAYDLYSTSVNTLSNQRYVFGGNGSFTIIDGEKLKSFDLPGLKSAVSNIVEDSRGRLWITTAETLTIIFDPKTGSFTDLRKQLDLNANGKFAKMLDSGDILLVTDNEVLEIDEELHVTHRITLPATLANYQNLKNKVVIFGEDNRLYSYHYIRKVLDELSIPNINELICFSSMNEDTNSFWVAQKNSGLLEYSEKFELIQELGKLEGMPSGGFDAQFCTLFDGQHVFSAYDKLFTVRNSANNLLENTFNSQVSIAKIEINNKGIINSQHNLGNFKQAEFPIKINFYRTGLANANDVIYAYRIDGLRESWNDLKQQTLTLDSLPAGDYTVEIKSKVLGENWNQPTKVSFSVLPPFWLNYWAFIFYALILVIGSWVFVSVKTQILRKRAEQLEAVVAQRTAELEQVLDRKNDEFVNVSHEFRTPLTLILGPINNLLKSTTSDKIKQSLEPVKRNGYRLLRMVDQLLQMEKLRVEQIVQKRPMNLKEISTRLVEPFIDLAKEKGISLNIRQVDEAVVSFTPDAYEKIILNLMSNALKYTESNGKIEFSLTSNNDRVVIRVSDTGIGIPKEKLHDIFERFNRVLDARSEQVTGAGIGLALVKELVESHDGEISVKSEIDKGSEFIFSFPTYSTVDKDDVQLVREESINQEFINLEVQSLKEQSGDVKSLEGIASKELSTDRTSILVVEDNLDMRNYIVETLRDNYEVSTAINGKDGLVRAKEVVPDLIVSDVMMPEMDGYELCRSLKEDEITSHIPLILLTARSDKASRLKGWKNNADEYLTKPFDSHELSLRIENLLSIRKLLKGRLFDDLNSAKISEHEELSTSAEINSKETIEDEETLWEANERKFVEKFSKVIDENLDDAELNIESLAKIMAVSERQLYRKLKGLLNVTPAEFLRNHRLNIAAEQLNAGEQITNVAFNVGFSSQSYFSRCFKAKYGKSPSQYQKDK